MAPTYWACPARQRLQPQLSVVLVGSSLPCSAVGSVTKLVNAIRLSLVTCGLSPGPCPCGSSSTPHPYRYLPSRSCSSPLYSARHMARSRHCMPICYRPLFGTSVYVLVMHSFLSSVALLLQCFSNCFWMSQYTTD